MNEMATYRTAGFFRRELRRQRKKSRVDSHSLGHLGEVKIKASVGQQRCQLEHAVSVARDLRMAIKARLILNHLAMSIHTVEKVLRRLDLQRDRLRMLDHGFRSIRTHQLGPIF